MIEEKENKIDGSSKVYSLILGKLSRRYPIPFKYGGRITRSQFNQALSQIRFNKNELKNLLLELTNNYRPFLTRYKRGIRINPNGDVK